MLKEADRNFAVLRNQLFRDCMEDDTAAGAAIGAEVGAVIEQTKRDDFYALSVLLRLRCLDSPVIAKDGSKAEWTIQRDYVPSAAPGSLAPACLASRRSLYILFGTASPYWSCATTTGPT